MRAVLLDVDGVLVTGRPADGLHWSHDLERDLGIASDLLQRRFFAHHWTDVVTGRVGLRETLAPVLAEIAPSVSSEALLEYWFAHDARLEEALLQDIASLRRDGLTVALASNQEHLRAHYLSEQLGLAGHVDHFYYSAAIGARKPDSAFYRHIEQALGEPPEALLLIDDTVENISAARQAGWRAVHWTAPRRLGDIVAEAGE
ncbi:MULTISPECIES: HAD-IA family hydrolase [unclassified Bosea (in: a-proteobacteria)]|uniref:HAD-IA family hydrolase n=1 Tax=unclassified Bosea (in: a-proteobacteria) TaxID=2653178 RepID=UPI00125F806C|nr:MULTISPECIES: HAD-IA family hydrolase [unclassified Bosea (in: a-proteobacteria)]